MATTKKFGIYANDGDVTVRRPARTLRSEGAGSGATALGHPVGAQR